jgi:L-threonylcarbamoyladenylate synthase
MARLGSMDDVVAALRGGGLACFPTETLWSLSCLATDQDAIQAVFAAKGRPEGVPLAVGFPSWEVATQHVRTTPGAEALAAAFLPGPVSIVLERTEPDLAPVAPGLPTLSIRVPDHPDSQAILRQTGPLVMTSANRHGEPDPRSAAQVLASLAGVTGLVVLDSPPVRGQASTVVDATGAKPVVLREGVITRAEVEASWRS